MTIRQELKMVVGELWTAISKTDATTSTAEIVDGAKTWKVTAERIYRHRAVRTAWSPCYFLTTPEGERLGGYGRATSFVDWAVRRITA